MEEVYVLAILVALVCCFVPCFLFFMSTVAGGGHSHSGKACHGYGDASEETSASKTSSAEKNDQSNDQAKKKPKMKKSDEDKKEIETSGVKDIEDLLRGSLIPITTRQMKVDGIIPYSTEQKVEMLAELEGHIATPNFMATVKKNNVNLTRDTTTVFQINVGLYCNQACSHCHVDSSPTRKAMMSREVANQCLAIIKNSPSITVVDLTGGAPEMNREFRYLVTECRKLNLRIIDRCNLTVLLEPQQDSLAQFLADNQVHVIASLPCYLEDNVDTQRGTSVFARSIEALKRLNKLGYGQEGSGLTLDLVYNPTGIHLPPNRGGLEVDYKAHLTDNYGIQFNSLICITNMPINRFYEFLKAGSNLDQYMGILTDNFNPKTCGSLMCRNYVSVDFNGRIFDCDFNQQVELHPKGTEAKGGVSVFDITCTNDMLALPIATGKHCFGCTAGQGSS